jgi:RAP domain
MQYDHAFVSFVMPSKVTPNTTVLYSWSKASAPVQVEALVCDHTRCADILVTVGAIRMIIEVDGPTHFVRDADGGIVSQDGRTQLRKHLFRAAGYEVLSVRVENRHPADFRKPEFVEWLHGGVKRRGMEHSGVRAPSR